MSDVSAEVQRLRDEAQAVDAEFMTAWNEANTWRFSLGPFRIRKRIGSQYITRVFVLFNSACFATGLILAPMSGALDTIGVSLIVGALFSFGSFIAQFWAIQAQHEFDMTMSLTGEAELKQILEKRNSVYRRLEELEREESSKRAAPEQA